MTSISTGNAKLCIAKTCRPPLYLHKAPVTSFMEMELRGNILRPRTGHYVWRVACLPFNLSCFDHQINRLQRKTRYTYAARIATGYINYDQASHAILQSSSNALEVSLKQL
ncbi:hypothetical protein PZA11_003981 [Diplocarpon coronariae]